MRASPDRLLGVVVVLALGWRAASARDYADRYAGGISGAQVLIAEEEGLCSGNSCGLCAQPCADACCSDGVKPECCDQHANVTFTIPYSAPRPVATTPCPDCGLCESIMAQPYVQPDVKRCCTAHPCGLIKQIPNSAPDPPQELVVQGENPYGANWTYEKHVKKFGLDTAAYATDNITKEAVALAVKDAEKVVYDMSNPTEPEELEPSTQTITTTTTTTTIHANGSNSTTNTSEWSVNDPRGVHVLLLPPGVQLSDWEKQTASPTGPPTESPTAVPTAVPTTNYSTYNNTNETEFEDFDALGDSDIEEQLAEAHLAKKLATPGADVTVDYMPESFGSAESFDEAYDQIFTQTQGRLDGDLMRVHNGDFNDEQVVALDVR